MTKKQLVGSKIKKWLEVEGYIAKLSFPQDFDFALNLFDKNDNALGYSISKPNNIDIIGISMNIKIPEEIIKNTISKLKEEEKTGVKQAMHRELLKIIQDHRIDKDLKEIGADERVYLDGFTRHRFMKSFLRVRNVQLYLMSVLRSKFGGEINTTSTSNHSMYG